MEHASTKFIHILAGPNGAGKTTFAREFLPHEANCQKFFNADLIAAGLSPFAPDLVAVRAGRLMLELIDTAVDRGESFAFETTLAARNYARAIPSWQSLGYVVNLHFIYLPTAELAIARVAERVQHGGHDIPEATIRRRFASGLANFERIYKPLVDAWTHYESWAELPTMNDSGGPRNPESARDGALAALIRARRRAEAIAAATGTAIIQAVDGKAVRVVAALDARPVELKLGRR